MSLTHDPEWITIDDAGSEELTLGQFEIDFFPDTNRAYLLSSMPVHNSMIVVGETVEERRRDCIHKAHEMIKQMLHEFEAEAEEMGVDLA